MTPSREATTRKVTPKRRDHPAYSDGLTRAYLRSAEDALGRLLFGRRQPEYEHIRAAFNEVLEATEIVRARLERRR